MVKILSLGAGVQSSTLALMAAAGEVERLDCAIFADTQAEPKSVYAWLDWLEKQLPFPVHRVTAGNLFDAATTVRASAKGHLYVKSRVPAFMANEDETRGIAMRQCTGDFKIDVINRKLRELRGGQRVEQWIGISVDEVRRMKDSRESWKTHRWPLIELRMTREDCKSWMRKHQYPTPPRSACVFCPFHSDREWLRLKEADPAAFAEAVDFERRFQDAQARVIRLKAVPFLHASLRPLDEIDFSANKEGQLSLFDNECEGMCGV